MRATKIFQIESGAQCNYSVNHNQLITQQQRNEMRMKKIHEAQLLSSMQTQLLEDREGLRKSDNGFDVLPERDQINDVLGMTTDVNHDLASEESENLVNLKNAVIVGIRLNDLDSIKNIDMNEISH